MGDLLHDAYGDSEHARVPAPRHEIDDSDTDSLVDAVWSWRSTREAVGAWSGVALARALTRPRTGSGAPAG